MDCRRAQELLSDYAEGSLEDPLRTELGEHLSKCGSCTELSHALIEVRLSLVAYPVPEPPPTLLEALGRRLPEPPRTARLGVLPPRVIATAAVLTLAGTLGVLGGIGAFPSSTRTARRVVDRGMNAGSWVLERRDRLMEDLRLAHVVISAAFQGRLDRMSDRVADYRRTLEKRQEETKGKGKGAEMAPSQTQHIPELGDA